MDIYLKTPGSNLLGHDKTVFDDICSVIDAATSEMLIRPDYSANMHCVDLISGIRNREITKEVVFVFRRKLRSNDPRVIVLTLKLLETLVNNCGTHWHECMNDDKLMKDIAGVARKFVAKQGADNKEAASVCLDMVQGWGEAFLARKAMYPNIVETYFTLRKEGLPFRVENQFDSSRVPIFNKPLSQDDYLDSRTDAVLAAAFQSSARVDQRRPSNSSRSPALHSSPRRSPPEVPPAESSKLAPREIVDSLHVTLPLLKDMILSANTASELTENDFASDILQQLKSCLAGMNTAIENAMDDPATLESLFGINDDAQLLANTFRDLQRGTLSLQQAKATVGKTLHNLAQSSAHSSSPGAPPPISHPAPQAHNGGAGKASGGHSPLLDFAAFGETQLPPSAGPHAGQQRHHVGTSMPAGGPAPTANTITAPPVAAQAPPPSAHTGGSAATSDRGNPPRVAIAPIPPPAPVKPSAAIPVLAPPPSAAGGTSASTASKERQPPKKLHYESSLEDVLVVQRSEDPFSPAALDALFETKKPVEQKSAKADPFSPEALDALFDRDSKPPLPVNAKPAVEAPRDPFSPAALDALFDTLPQPRGVPASGPYPQGAPGGMTQPPAPYYARGYPPQQLPPSQQAVPGQYFPGQPHGQAPPPRANYPPIAPPGPAAYGYVPYPATAQNLPPGYGGYVSPQQQYAQPHHYPQPSQPHPHTQQHPQVLASRYTPPSGPA